MNMTRATAVLLSVISVLACTPSYTSTSNPPSPYPYIVKYGRALSVTPISPESTTITDLSLEILPVHAVVARWFGRIPTPELVLVQDGSAWRATLGDKSRLEGWRAAVKPALNLSADALQHISGEENAALKLASDLRALLVDPDPSLARVITSRDEVPLHHSLSDVRKDLEREGFNSEDIDARLMERVPPSLEEPRLSEIEDGRYRLIFTTWDLHGGRLETWQVQLGSEPSVHVELVAENTGSYRRFFY